MDGINVIQQSNQNDSDVPQKVETAKPEMKHEETSKSKTIIKVKLDRPQFCIIKGTEITGENCLVFELGSCNLELTSHSETTDLNLEIPNMEINRCSLGYINPSISEVYNLINLLSINLY